ncbi:unnamed protein product, partial [Urochloa humidicola]
PYLISFLYLSFSISHLDPSLQVQAMRAEQDGARRSLAGAQAEQAEARLSGAGTWVSAGSGH